MEDSNFEAVDFWRAVILFGLNTATYKIALGAALANFVQRGQTSVSMWDLATVFFDLYLERLKDGKPQLSSTGRQTKMETAIGLFNTGAFTREQAIAMVQREAFDNVIPRFHTVNGAPLPVTFYESSSSGLVLTDNVFKVFTSQSSQALQNELNSRWGLLEAAFSMRDNDTKLVNDIRQFYLAKGYERTDITGTRPVLNGYQNGVCFYCGEAMAESEVHVDHVIPRQLVYHDEIWNLVLAHSFCNEQKSDALPDRHYIHKLVERNEFLIASNHPIKGKLMQQLGKTSESRRKYTMKVFEDARLVIGYTWEGIRGYNPQTDMFYKTFIRSLSK